MSEPSSETIQQIKSQFSDRSLHLVEKFSPADDGVKYHFLMTGPTRDELDKFDEDMLKAKDKGSTEAEKKVAIRGAVERTAYALIRWPEREEVKRIFNLHSEMVFSFAEDIRNFAGASFETRSKKL